MFWDAFMCFAGGDLFNVLANHKASGVSIPQDMIVKWLYQTCRGLEAIHAAKTIHRDIKVRYTCRAFVHLAVLIYAECVLEIRTTFEVEETRMPAGVHQHSRPQEMLLFPSVFTRRYCGICHFSFYV